MGIGETLSLIGRIMWIVPLTMIAIVIGVVGVVALVVTYQRYQLKRQALLPATAATTARAQTFASQAQAKVETLDVSAATRAFVVMLEVPGDCRQLVGDAIAEIDRTGDKKRLRNFLELNSHEMYVISWEERHGSFTLRHGRNGASVVMIIGQNNEQLWCSVDWKNPDEETHLMLTKMGITQPNWKLYEETAHLR